MFRWLVLTLTLMYGSVLLCGSEPCRVAAVPTEKQAVLTETPTVPTESQTVPTESTTVPTGSPTVPTESPTVPTESLTTVTEEGRGADNITTTEESKGFADPVSTDIWQISENAADETVPETDGLIFRSDWGSRKQVENLETMEGWLNSGIISNDVNIPYRALGVWNRVGNSSEDWKKYLTKPSTLEHYHHDKISKINYNERRRFPFQFHWQNNPKRKFNYTKTMKAL